MSDAIKEQIQQIFALNTLDIQIQEFQEGLADIPIRLGELETLLGEKKSALADKTKQLEGLEKTKRDLEGEVALAESRLQEFQGKLSQIKTNKEYQAAMKEVADTKRANAAKEDQILEKMTLLEGVKKEKEALDEDLKGIVSNYEKERSDLETEEKRLNEQILDLMQGRNKLVASLQPEIASKYEKVRKIRREAVAFIENGICQGCNMHIAPQLYIEIQKLKAVHCCPSCYRILYLEQWQKVSAPTERAL